MFFAFSCVVCGRWVLPYIPQAFENYSVYNITDRMLQFDEIPRELVTQLHIPVFKGKIILQMYEHN